MRRRPARVPQHRRACPRRCLVGGGPLRGRRYPRRSRHLLLSRRARVAVLLPVDDRAQHGELDGQSQSSEGGPFMWVRHAHAREIEVVDDGDIARWTAEHDGYASLDPPALHRRSVLLDRASRSIDIIDEIEGGSHDIRLAFHLGPEVQVELDGACAILDWPAARHTEVRRGWNCRPGSGGPCTEARVTPSSAGTLRAWDVAFPPSASSAADVAWLALPWPPGWNSSKSASCPRLLFPDGTYHGRHPTRVVTRRRRSKRRPDEPAGTGSAEIRPDRAAA